MEPNGQDRNSPHYKWESARDAGGSSLAIWSKIKLKPCTSHVSMAELTFAWEAGGRKNKTETSKYRKETIASDFIIE